jgi:hypothetical protein
MKARRVVVNGRAEGFAATPLFAYDCREDGGSGIGDSDPGAVLGMQVGLP